MAHMADRLIVIKMSIRQTDGFIRSMSKLQAMTGACVEGKARQGKDNDFSMKKIKAKRSYSNRFGWCVTTNSLDM